MTATETPFKKLVLAGAAEGMEQGWAESLYRLADILEETGGRW